MNDFDPDVATLFHPLDAIEPPAFETLTAQSAAQSNTMGLPLADDLREKSTSEFGAAELLVEPADESRDRRPLVLALSVAAAVAIVGLALTFVSPASKNDVASETIAESLNDNDQQEGTAGGELAVVRGPETPFVVIGTSPNASDVQFLAIDCGLRLAEVFGETPFVEASAILVDGVTYVVGRTSVLGATACYERPGVGISPAGPGAQGPQTNIAAADPIEVSSINAIDSSDGDSRLVLIGRLDEAVEDVTITSPFAVSQGFHQSGDWFAIEWSERTDSHEFNAAQGYQIDFSVLRSDGTTERLTWSGSTRNDDCFSGECIAEQLSRLELTARQEGLTSQAEALADGVLTQTEYDAAVSDFGSCLTEAELWFPDSETVAIQAGAEDAATATECWRQHLQLVEETRSWDAWRQLASFDPAVDDGEPADGGEEEAMETETFVEPPSSELAVDLRPIEGQWLSEVIPNLAQELPMVDEEDLWTALQTIDPEPQFVAGSTADPERRWEGLLSPGEYSFGADHTATEVVQDMHSQFVETTMALGYGDSIERVGLTPYEVVIVASLVEAEAEVDTDRGMVARVIYNRLEQGLAMGLDSALYYGAQDRNFAVTAESLDMPGPYNLRGFDNLDLTPTPIATPSRESLEAAIDPTPGDWLHYVIANEQGKLTFVETDEEFREAVENAERQGLLE